MANDPADEQLVGIPFVLMVCLLCIGLFGNALFLWGVPVVFLLQILRVRLIAYRRFKHPLYERAAVSQLAETWVARHIGDDVGAFPEVMKELLQLQYYLEKLFAEGMISNFPMSTLVILNG